MCKHIVSSTTYLFIYLHAHTHTHTHTHNRTLTATTIFKNQCTSVCVCMCVSVHVTITKKKKGHRKEQACMYDDSKNKNQKDVCVYVCVYVSGPHNKGREGGFTYIHTYKHKDTQGGKKRV